MPDLQGFWKPDEAVVAAERQHQERLRKRAKRRREKARERRKNRKWSIRIKKTAGWEERCWMMRPEKFYRTNVWWALRRRVLKAYESICMRCGSTEKIQVDHIKPRSLYPRLSLEFSNMQVLCKPCNQKKSNIDMTDYR